MNDSEKILEQKINAVMTFIVILPDGEVDHESSYKAFSQALTAYAEKHNCLIETIRPFIEEILNEDSFKFVGMDELKYSVRKNLETKDLSVTGDELNHIIDDFIKNKFLVSRRGRSGGVQLLNNAVGIVARSKGKNIEITSEFCEAIKAELLADKG